ncbi:MAG: extracellular solute-binding protein [Gammaproteobacteria bacterium]|nr:extracellular solute-binding protein [Gammaproteobacteria bacterium]
MKYRSLMQIFKGTACTTCLASSMLVSSGAQAWSLEEAAEPYRGTEINVICEGYPPCYALRDVSPEFTERTGIKVNFEFGDLLAIAQRMLAEQLTGSEYFDGMQVLSYHLGLFGEQGFYTPLQKFMDDPKLRDPNFKVEDFVPALFQQSSVYNGTQVALPFQYLATFGVIRKDIVADPDERKAFKAKYGRELPEPGLIMEIESYDQWRDLAEFFTRKKGETLAGKVLENDVYGTSAPFKRHLTVFWMYWATLVANGGEIFDVNGNVATDKGTAAADSLQWLLDMREYAPPSYREYTWDEQYRDFCAGLIFMTTFWPDAVYYLEDSNECVSAGNIGYFVLPNTHRSMPFVYSWVIPPTAKNPEGSYLLMQWALSRDIQEKATPMGWIATTRADVISMDWSGHPQIHGDMAIKRVIADNDWVYDLPHHPALIAAQDIMMDELSAAGADKIDASTAIKNMADRTRKAVGQ